MQSIAVLVPLKGFHLAKSRLRRGGVENVDDLTRSLARTVLSACDPRPVFVACESTEVALFARECRAGVILSHCTDLNGAVAHAYQQLGDDFERLIIAHGDLRDPRGLGSFTPREGVTIYADSHGMGTNVLVLPTKLTFEFHFGSRSAQAHENEAKRLGLAVYTDFESPWRFDIDEPGDLQSKK